MRRELFYTDPIMGRAPEEEAVGITHIRMMDDRWTPTFLEEVKY